MVEEGNEDEMVGYRQQPGKLPFAKPGSGGKERFSRPTDEGLIPESQGGGVLFPRWFDDGTNLYLDTNLQWHRHLLPGGLVFPSKYVSIDSSGAIHSISCNLANPSVNGCDGSFSLTHFLSLDGGLTWTNFTHLWPDATAVGNQATFEWDMQADGNLDLLVLSMRVQTARNNSAGGEGCLLYTSDAADE